jgi:hypothetical protein
VRGRIILYVNFISILKIGTMEQISKAPRNWGWWGTPVNPSTGEAEVSLDYVMS